MKLNYLHIAIENNCTHSNLAQLLQHYIRTILQTIGANRKETPHLNTLKLFIFRADSKP